MTQKKPPRKPSVLTGACVACGCCEKVCPREAIWVHRGIYALVDLARCVGCGKCARECPAAVITMEEAL